MKYLKISSFLIISCLLGCTDESDFGQSQFTYVASNSVENINSGGATFRGILDLQDPSEITDFGFVWQQTINTFQYKHSLINDYNSIPENFEYRLTSDLESGLRYNVSAYVEAENYNSVGGELTFTAQGSEQAVVTAISTNEGFFGDEITLIGNNFSLNPFRVRLYFFDPEENPAITLNKPGLLADFASFESLKFILTENVFSSVDNQILLQSGADLVLLSQGFRLNNLQFDGFNPGSASVGDVVSIFGFGFENDVENNRVFVDGVEAEITEASYTTLSFRVPEGLSPGDVYVSVQIFNTTYDLNDNLFIF